MSDIELEIRQNFVDKIYSIIYKTNKTFSE
jgi:hypothetical protein